MGTIRNFMLSAVLILGVITGCATPAYGEPAIGDEWSAGNYCIGENLEFIKAFTDAVVRNGMDAYRRLMNSPQIPCYDQRMHPVPVIQVILKEKLWDFELPGGEKLTMWLVEDFDGTLGYIWIAPESNET